MISLLAIGGGLCMAFCQWLIYFYAPIEETLGPIQKIFYLHLPLAWWALVSFFLVFCGSIAYILKRRTAADNLCAAAAEIGLVFCSLALASGMIWAKKSWGVWWTWDPRLTTTFVMWFIYAAYLLLRQLDMAPARRRMVGAVLGIVAFLDVPLVFLSARLFRSIHPAVFGKGGGLSAEMRMVVFATIFSLGLLWLGLLLFRFRQLEQASQLDAAREWVLDKSTGMD